MTFDKLLDIVKMFLEKCLIPTVLSVVLTFVTYYKTPEDFSMLVKFTVTGYCIFTFCIWFLAIYFIMWLIKMIFHGIKNLFEKANANEKLNKMQLKDEEKTLEVLWGYVDKLSIPDYKLLVQFLETENQPYCDNGTYFGECLLNSNLVHRSLIEEERQEVIKPVSNSNAGNRIMFPMYETIPAKYHYILKREIYDLLKYSQEKYGRISHFER